MSNDYMKQDWQVKNNGMWDISIVSQDGGTICHINNKGEWFPKDGATKGRSQDKMLELANHIVDMHNRISRL